MKESGDMRFKQVIDGSRRAPIFLKSDARKQHGRHKSIKAPHSWLLNPFSPVL